MNPLGEALAAAQRQAIGALAKPYVAGNIGTEEVTSRLAEIGCNDVTDTAQLLAAWDVLQEYGAPAPKPTQPEPQKSPEHEPASEAQTRYIAKLADERGTTAPDYRLSKENASKVIEQLKAGTYNPDEWTVPF